MLHTIAFSSSVSATTTVLTNLSGVADPVVRVSGNFIYLPALSNIAGTYQVGVGITGAQLQAPGLRSFINLDLAPLDIAASPASDDVLSLHLASPIKLSKDEALSALATTNVPGSAVHNSVIVHLTDGPIAPVSGEFHTVKFTIAPGSGDYAWVNSAMTLSQSLPVGSYTVAGVRLEGAGLIAGRFVPVGGTYRPGFICAASSSSPEYEDQRYGKMGAFLDFDELTPPTIDTFGVGVTGTLTGYLDLLKK